MDKQYFTTELPSQYAMLGQATVTVYLHNGALFEIERLIGAFDQYVILSVYHKPNTDEESNARLHPVRNEIAYDQVSVPYHQSLTCTPQEKLRQPRRLANRWDFTHEFRLKPA